MRSLAPLLPRNPYPVEAPVIGETITSTRRCEVCQLVAITVRTPRHSQYLALLLTYSGHRAMPPAARNGLLACIGELINTRYGGHVTKGYLTELRLAHRIA
jgi:hypothetical protein